MKLLKRFHKNQPNSNPTKSSIATTNGVSTVSVGPLDADSHTQPSASQYVDRDLPQGALGANPTSKAFRAFVNTFSSDIL